MSYRELVSATSLTRPLHSFPTHLSLLSRPRRDPPVLHLLSTIYIFLILHRGRQQLLIRGFSENKIYLSLPMPYVRSEQLSNRRPAKECWMRKVVRSSS